LASSTRSSTLSILFRISACAAGARPGAGGGGGVEPGQAVDFLLGIRRRRRRRPGQGWRLGDLDGDF
jgi:hypothetical protein